MGNLDRCHTVNIKHHALPTGLEYDIFLNFKTSQRLCSMVMFLLFLQRASESSSYAHKILKSLFVFVLSFLLPVLNHFSFFKYIFFHFCFLENFFLDLFFPF